jgi:predicted KAP-like P-loop ATPase
MTVFDSDQPIKTHTEDLLARTHYAGWLGDAILAQRGIEPLVMALNGPWGSGKSSLLNLAVERIEDRAKSLRPENRPIIVRFNPGVQAS